MTINQQSRKEIEEILGKYDCTLWQSGQTLYVNSLKDNDNEELTEQILSWHAKKVRELIKQMELYIESLRDHLGGKPSQYNVGEFDGWTQAINQLKDLIEDQEGKEL